MVGSQLANYQLAIVLRFLRVAQSYFGLKPKLGPRNRISTSTLICVTPCQHRASSQCSISNKFDSFKIFYNDNKSFSSSLYQLTDSKLEKNRPVHDRICPIGDTVYAELLVQSKNHRVKIKRTLKYYQKNIKITILNVKTKR